MTMTLVKSSKDGNFTVMGNYHLYDRGLTLKAKGLFSLILSLPNNWTITLAGLATMNDDGISSVRASIRELENRGYIIRRRERDENGKFGNSEYIIFENPIDKDSYMKQLNSNTIEKIEKDQSNIQGINEPKQDVSAFENINENDMFMEQNYTDIFEDFEEDMSNYQAISKQKQDDPVLEKPMLENPTLDNQTLINTNVVNTNILNNNYSEKNNYSNSNTNNSTTILSTNDISNTMIVNDVQTSDFLLELDTFIDLDILLFRIKNSKLKEAFMNYVKMRMSSKKYLTDDDLKILVDKVIALPVTDEQKISLLHNAMINKRLDIELSSNEQIKINHSDTSSSERFFEMELVSSELEQLLDDIMDDDMEYDIMSDDIIF